MAIKRYKKHIKKTKKWLDEQLEDEDHFQRVPLADSIVENFPQEQVPRTFFKSQSIAILSRVWFEGLVN